MHNVLKDLIGPFLCFLLTICICFDSVEAQYSYMTTHPVVESNQNSMDTQSIDDLLGPDQNFPFDPANHRDGSNPIKRIGKIKDENL